MKGSLYTIVYAVVLGTVCAVFLTGAGQFTKKYRDANERADQVRNILRVLDVPFDAEAPARELLELFNRNVREIELDGLRVFQYVDSGKVKGSAVAFEGQGLWGPVHGLLALEPDMKTIRGVSFYKQEETPGLGGEIASDWFQDQFKGKSIVDAAGKAGIRIRSGKHLGSNEVEAITGATMTSDKVEIMLNEVIRRIVEEGKSHDG